jgi:hypothetical protein
MCGYQIDVPGPMNENNWNHLRSLETTSHTTASDFTPEEKASEVEVTSIHLSHSTPSQEPRNRTMTWVRPYDPITNNPVIQKDILKFRLHAFSIEGVLS